MNASDAGPLTPDFVTYPTTTAPRVLGVDDRFTTIGWDDGHTHRFHHLVLVENAGAEVVDALTRERLAAPDFVPLDVRPTDVRVEGAHLRVSWPGRPPVLVHGGWLRAIADGHGRIAYAIPAPVPWDLASLPELPTHDGPAVLGDDGALHCWLRDVAVHGLARLRDLPTDDATVARVAERIGVVRDTSFGRLFEVQSKPDADSIAYTSHELLPHTDLPTRELPPGYQLLHCRVNTCPDGLSTMVDSLTVAALVRAERPDLFDNLTTTVWVHTNRSPVYDYRWAAPVLATDRHGTVTGARLLHTLRTFPDVADDEITTAYEAVRYFTSVSTRPELMHRTPFAPGDLVMFDNARILHGRGEFDPTSGDRHLQGCYLDRDELTSRLRILQRSAPEPTNP